MHLEGNDMGMFLGRSHFFIIIEKKINKNPSKIMFTVIKHWSELGNLLSRWSETES